MRASPLLALLPLVACSPGSAPAPAPTGAAAAHDSATGGTTARASATGAGLHGDVSPLNGTVSDFKVTVSDTETIVKLPADILFAFDSADLAPAAQSPLARTAALIAKSGQGDIRIVGHTDAKGEDAYNVALSGRRAQSVADWLAANSAAAARFKPEGRGEAEPVAPNQGPGGADDPAGRARNRRVVIYIPR